MEITTGSRWLSQSKPEQKNVTQDNHPITRDMDLRVACFSGIRGDPNINNPQSAHDRFQSDL